MPSGKWVDGSDAGSESFPGPAAWPWSRCFPLTQEEGTGSFGAHRTEGGLQVRAGCETQAESRRLRRRRRFRSHSPGDGALEGDGGLGGQQRGLRGCSGEMFQLCRSREQGSAPQQRSKGGPFSSKERQVQRPHPSPSLVSPRRRWPRLSYLALSLPKHPGKRLRGWT